MLMRRRMGRPGLVGTMARTAVVAGTAGAVHHRQQRRYAERDQQEYEAAAYEQQQAEQAAAAAAPPAAPAAAAPDMAAELQKLADLKASGVLTDEEFAAAKAKLLAG
jgi:Short C-terminal domain